MALKVGDVAPDFTLLNTETQEVSLSSFKGSKVVIHFFPLAFTGVCTEQLCALRDDFGFYQGINAQVLGISVDSPFTLGKFKEEQRYQFPLLSDFNKTTAQAYGAFYPQFVLGLQGVAKRAAFVLDEEGKILYAEVLEDALKLPDFEAINKALKG